MIDNPTDIIEMDTESLWKAFKQLKEDIGGLQEEEHTIKYGKRVKIPIWYITKQWYIEKPKSAKAVIKGFGTYDLYEFLDEIEYREYLMRKVLIDNIDQDIHKGREN